MYASTAVAAILTADAVGEVAVAAFLSALIPAARCHARYFCFKMTLDAGVSPFIVSAPANEAFDQTPLQLGEYSLESQHTTDSGCVFTDRVSISEIPAADLRDLVQGEEILTLDGGRLRVAVHGNFADATAAIDFASNGR
jgi:hypothetical protein